MKTVLDLSELFILKELIDEKLKIFTEEELEIYKDKYLNLLFKIIQLQKTAL